MNIKVENKKSWLHLTLLLFFGWLVIAPAWAGNSILEFESGDNVKIKEPKEDVKYKSIVFFAPNEPVFGVNGLSFARRQKWNTNNQINELWVDDDLWDLAILGKTVGGQNKCFFIRNIKLDKLSTVSNEVPLLTNLGFDKSKLISPIGGIVGYLKLLSNDKGPTLVKEERLDAHKLSTSATLIEDYLKRAFKDKDLECTSIVGWTKFIELFDFSESGIESDNTVERDLTDNQELTDLKNENVVLNTRNQTLQGKVQRLKTEKQQIEQERNGIETKYNNLKRENGELQQQIAAQKNLNMSKDLSNGQLHNILTANLSEIKTGLGTANAELRGINSVVSVMQESGQNQTGTSARATSGKFKGFSINEIINWMLLILAGAFFPLLIIYMIYNSKNKQISAMSKEIGKIQDDLRVYSNEGVKGTDSKSEGVKGDVPGVPSAPVETLEAEWLVIFIHKLNEQIDQRLNEVKKSASNINTVMRNLLGAIERTAPVFEQQVGEDKDRGEDIAELVEISNKIQNKPDQSIFNAITVLSKVSYPSNCAQERFDTVLEKLEGLCQLLTGIDKSLSNTDQFIELAFQRTNQQLNRKETAILNLNQEIEGLKSAASESDSAAKQQLEDFEAKVIELDTANLDLERVNTELTAAKDGVQKILIAFDYFDEKNQTSDMTLLLQDMQSRSEHLAYGAALVKLRAYLEEHAQAEAKLFAACEFDEILQSLKDGSNLSLFMDGSPKDSMLGRWRGSLSLIYRANLLLNTYWPNQHETLQEILAESIGAIEQLLNKRGIFPHDLALLEQAELVDSKIGFSPNSPVGEGLVKTANFCNRVKPMLKLDETFCDIALWGYDLEDERGTKAVGEESRLIGQNEDSKWPE